LPPPPFTTTTTTTSTSTTTTTTAPPDCLYPGGGSAVAIIPATTTTTTTTTAAPCVAYYVAYVPGAAHTVQYYDCDTDTIENLSVTFTGDAGNICTNNIISDTHPSKTFANGSCTSPTYNCVNVTFNTTSAGTCIGGKAQITYTNCSGTVVTGLSIPAGAHVLCVRADQPFYFSCGTGTITTNYLCNADILYINYLIWECGTGYSSNCSKAGTTYSVGQTIKYKVNSSPSIIRCGTIQSIAYRNDAPDATLQSGSCSC
jgi:hypothetical protein